MDDQNNDVLPTEGEAVEESTEATTEEAAPAEEAA